ncbi:hypothetical protein C8Q77DRAFT_1092419 [Trametes polyzona]|nr:hypothetical protein C8Q77DRAFT_1092419 [Trametes polyzona]
MAPVESHVVTVLEGLENVAGAIPIPALSKAVGLALNIAKLVKEVKETKEECQALANRAAEKVADIYDELKDCGTAVDGTQESLENLLLVLRDIQGMMERRRKKSFVKSLRHLESNKATIKELTTRLQDSIDTFQLRNTIRANHRMSELQEMTDRILLEAQESRREHLLATERLTALVIERTDKSRLTKFDVKLLEPMDDEDDAECTGGGASADADQDRKVVRYRAELREDRSPLVVKRYVNRDGRFSDDVEFVKSMW